MLASVHLDGDVSEYCFDTHDNKVFCTVPTKTLVQVIDGASDSVVASIPAQQPRGICYSPQVKRIYWGNGSGDTVTVVDAAADTVVARVKMGAWSFDCCYNPQSSKAYFGAYASNDVTVIDCATTQPLATLQVHGIPWALCYDPHTNAVYSANRDTMNVTVIDGFADTIIKNLPPYGVPTSLVFNPIQNRVYVGSEAGNRVTVIRDTGMGGVEETPSAEVRTTNMAVLVRGVLWLTPATSRKPQASSRLMDITGRKVLDLRPDANDVSYLAPGVYFVCSELSALSRQPSPRSSLPDKEKA